MLKVISRGLISLVFPVSCELCGDVVPSGRQAAVCAPCEGALPLAPLGDPAPSQSERFHFDRVFFATAYEGPVKKLLKVFKFKRARLLGPVLVRLLQRRLTGIPANWDVITAVPMGRRELLERGFNQAESLARGVSGLLGKPFQKDALSVVGVRKQQARLDRAQRRENTRGRFRAKITVSGKRVLLVDDILTTGQTASECARALKDAGALSVDVLVAARGL
jgi:competence protein ComFC